MTFGNIYKRATALKDRWLIKGVKIYIYFQERANEDI